MAAAHFLRSRFSASDSQFDVSAPFCKETMTMEFLSMPDTMADRRIAPRYPLIIMAEIRDSQGENRLNARTSDISRTGCYIDTLNPLPTGTKIRLRLFREGEVFECAATVVYANPSLGMGIQFDLHAPQEQVMTVARWLESAGLQPL